MSLWQVQPDIILARMYGVDQGLSRFSFLLFGYYRRIEEYYAQAKKKKKKNRLIDAL